MFNNKNIFKIRKWEGVMAQRRRRRHHHHSYRQNVVNKI